MCLHGSLSSAPSMLRGFFRTQRKRERSSFRLHLRPLSGLRPVFDALVSVGDRACVPMKTYTSPSYASSPPSVSCSPRHLSVLWCKDDELLQGSVSGFSQTLRETWVHTDTHRLLLLRASTYRTIRMELAALAYRGVRTP